MLWVFGLFALSVLATAAAPGYVTVLLSRLATALVHAVFWSIVPTTAASLFPADARSRVVPALFIGSSLGSVLGVPAAAWVGLHEGWRAAFVGAGLFAAALFAVLVALLPAPRRGEETAATGARPDGTEYVAVLAVCALGFGAVFTFQTYVTLFLTHVSGFAPATLGLVLVAGGVGGTVGVAAGGWRVSRAPYQALLVPLVTIAAVLVALSSWPSRLVAVVAVLLVGCATGALATAVQVRVLAVAPGSTDVASAGSSSMINVGIAGGALLGGLLVSTAGVRWVPLAGGCVALAATAVMLRPGAKRSTPSQDA
jgi:DHA1 family inner membrane transport protein